jgi:hypothetical protein
MVRRVKKGLPRERSPVVMTTVALAPELVVNKKAAKVTAALLDLICPLLKRSEMSRLRIKSAAFAERRMRHRDRQRTQGLLRSMSRLMFG